MDRYVMLKTVIGKGLKSAEVINKILADYFLLDLLSEQEYQELHGLNTPEPVTTPTE